MTQTMGGDGEARTVIAVAGPVGAGKSTLVHGLASRLPGAATIHFDQYERITEQPIEKIKLWMQQGADLDEMVIPGLGEALLELKRGGSVANPLTGNLMAASKYVLFETQFGRQHAATGRHIDFLVWVDTPLDVALARKIRQFAGELNVQDLEQTRRFIPWLSGYLENYGDVVGSLLRIQRDTVGENADLRVDGGGDAGALLLRVEQEILSRFA